MSVPDRRVGRASAPGHIEIPLAAALGLAGGTR